MTTVAPLAAAEVARAALNSGQTPRSERRGRDAPHFTSTTAVATAHKSHIPIDPLSVQWSSGNGAGESDFRNPSLRPMIGRVVIPAMTSEKRMSGDDLLQ
jgi:hypothetical protein